MPSAFDVLASDHEQVKRLLSHFEAAPASPGVLKTAGPATAAADRARDAATGRGRD